MSTQTILVIRATGTQGKAVTEHLVEKGFTVHALVRDTTDARALAIQSIGATLFEGSLDDAGAIARAISGCTGLFLNLMPSFTDDSETQQAKHIINAAKSAGVSHVVHSTNLSIPRPEEGKNWDPKSIVAPALDGKQAVEEMVRKAGFNSWTILRPGVFMTNFFAPFGGIMFPELLSRGLFVSSYRPDTILPLIDAKDIGLFASSAFLDPIKFGGEEIRLVGDPLRVDAIVQAISKASGKIIKASYRSAEETETLAKINPFVAGQLSSLNLYKYVDMEEVSKWGLELGTLQRFLDREHVLVEKTFENIV